MASATYGFRYEVTGGTSPGPYTLSAPVTGSFMIRENEFDAIPDTGSTPPGVTVIVDGNGEVLQYVVVTGDPVVIGDPNIPYLYSNNGSLGSSIAENVGAPLTYCFGAGTGIATPAGERAVETLCPGDTVLTADGQAVPVLWLGKRTFTTLFAPQARQLVRITAGALGDGLPSRDLVVTADHGLLLDGLVVNAGALIGGRGISRVPVADLPQEVTVYHIETEAHVALIANGVPAESFADVTGRVLYDNQADYLTRYGAARILREMPLPRIASARLLPESLRNRLGMPAAEEAGLPLAG